MKFFFEKKLFILSLWKLTRGYGTMEGAGKQLPNMLGKVLFVSPFHYIHIFGECLWLAMK
jgi:hypothetical protein